mgnify:CR=1 FL=1
MAKGGELTMEIRKPAAPGDPDRLAVFLRGDDGIPVRTPDLIG